MPNKIITIKNAHGLHARAAAMLVKLTHKYKSDIFIRKDNLRANGKSMLGVLTLGALYGADLEIETEGPDAQELLEAVIELIERKFDEEV